MERKDLEREIKEHGINKRNYSSAEESDSDKDSDEELLMKFIPKKKNRDDFNIVGYSFQLSIRISKLRSELARSEERLRYLQLDYNNKNIEIELLKERVTKQLDIIKQKNENLKLSTQKTFEFEINKKIMFISILINILFYFNII